LINFLSSRTGECFLLLVCSLAHSFPAAKVNRALRFRISNKVDFSSLYRSPATSVWSLYKLAALLELAVVYDDGSMKEALAGAGEELADDSASAMAGARRTSHKRRS
jgi:hypothetical protein